MSSSRRNKDLQRYFDGELRPGRAEKIRRQLEEIPADRQRLANLTSMRSLLRDSADHAVSEAKFDHLWTKVQAGVAAQQPLPFGERLRLWLRRYGLVAASATAAAVLATFLLQPFFVETHDRNDCEIESLDVDPGTVSTIFTIYTPEKDDKTTVIWLNESEEPPPEGDKD